MTTPKPKPKRKPKRKGAASTGRKAGGAGSGKPTPQPQPVRPPEPVPEPPPLAPAPKDRARCQATVRDGRRCAMRALPGWTTCRIHTGYQPAPADRVVGGRAAAAAPQRATDGPLLTGHLRHLRPSARETVELALADPAALLDGKRAVALHLATLEHVPFALDDRQVEALAEQIARVRASGSGDDEDRKVTEADRQAVRAQAQRNAQAALEVHQRLVTQAAAVAEARAVAREEALPVLVSFATRLAVITKRFVPPAHQAAFAAAVKQALAQAVGSLGRVEDVHVQAARAAVADALPTGSDDDGEDTP